MALAASGLAHACLDCRGQCGLSEDSVGSVGSTLAGHVMRGIAAALAGRPERLMNRAHYLDALRLTR